ncbi:MAG: hypothetical protein ACLFQB_12435 [Chitinispirillaceae bacterium]
MDFWQDELRGAHERVRHLVVKSSDVPVSRFMQRLNSEAPRATPFPSP